MACTAGPIPFPFGVGENRPPRFRQSRAPGLVAARDALFPLPEGEGKGEGESDVANQNGRTNLASSIRLAPRAGGLCYPNTNFRLPSRNHWRKPPSALVSRAFFPPHPGPLPLGGGGGECFADLGGFIVNLSSILRLHQWGQPVDRSNPNQPGPAATPPRAPRGRQLPAPRRALAAENPTALRTYSFAAFCFAAAKALPAIADGCSGRGSD